MTVGLPQARTSELLVESSGEELLVLDERTAQVHRLNRTAACIFSHADGTKSVHELLEKLGEVTDLADADLVELTLAELADAGLMVDAEPPVREEQRATRRRFIRRIGVVGAAALALPIVQTISAPAPAYAASAGSSTTSSSTTSSTTSGTTSSQLPTSQFSSSSSQSSSQSASISQSSSQSLSQSSSSSISSFST